MDSQELGSPWLKHTLVELKNKGKFSIAIRVSFVTFLNFETLLIDSVLHTLIVTGV